MISSMAPQHISNRALCVVEPLKVLMVDLVDELYVVRIEVASMQALALTGIALDLGRVRVAQGEIPASHEAVQRMWKVFKAKYSLAPLPAVSAPHVF
mmetsp:Transcript_46473/g.85152  ORF Transcript_46473/g.85152 Transcript_46473/m.85152 type:complete len:97 (+) Transcript_46473:99-389(+)